MKTKWFWTSLITLIFMLLGTACFFAVRAAGNILAEMLLYNGRTIAEWQTPTLATCTGWVAEVGFAPQPLADDTGFGLEVKPSCKEILLLATEHRKTLNENSQSIHYAVFPLSGSAPTEPVAQASQASQVSQDQAGPLKTPLWVHFHGINGNYLHGARYLGAAGRLGFQLVAAELVNHGISTSDGKGAAYGCKEHSDVEAVIKDLLVAFPGRNILVSASSMGTMAVALAQKNLAKLDQNHRILAYALENPISSVKEIVMKSPAGKHFPSLLVDLGLAFARSKSGFDFNVCSPMNEYPYFLRPTLVQHSESDDFAPVEMGQKVFDALPAEVPKLLRRYAKGKHSAVWNAQMAEFESDLAKIWQLGLDFRSSKVPSEN